MDEDSDDSSVACSDHRETLKKNNQFDVVDAKELLTMAWVQCEKPDCLKWRSISKSEANALGDKPWFCHMNRNPKFGDCDVPEEDFEDKDDMVELCKLVYVTSIFPPGSLVWAKMPGYCWWPGMIVVDRKEDLSVSVDKDGDPLCYHVEFLGRKRTRAWIPEHFVEMYGEHVHVNSFTDHHQKMSSNDKTSYNGQSVKEAIKEADSWRSLTLHQRLEKSHFSKITSVKNVPMICNESMHKRQNKRQISKSDDLENIPSRRKKSLRKEDFDSDPKIKRPKNAAKRQQLSSETEVLSKDKEASEVAQDADSVAQLDSTSLEPQTVTSSSEKVCKEGEKEPDGSKKVGVGKKKVVTVNPVAERAEVHGMTCTQDETLESVQDTRASAGTDDASDFITENKNKTSDERDNALKDLSNVRSNLGPKKSFCPPVKAKTTTEAVTKKKSLENKESVIATEKIPEKIDKGIPAKKIPKKECKGSDKEIPGKLDKGIPAKKVPKKECAGPDKEIPEIPGKIDNGMPAKKIPKKECKGSDKEIPGKIDKGIPAKKTSKKECQGSDKKIRKMIDNGVLAKKKPKKEDTVVTREPLESKESEMPAMKSSAEKDTNEHDVVRIIESCEVEDEDLNLYLSESETQDNAEVQHGDSVQSDFEHLAAENFSECGNEEKASEKPRCPGRLLDQSASMIGRSKEERYSIDVQMYLENHDRFERDIRAFMAGKGRQIHKLPLWENRSIGLFELFLAVHEFGGYDTVCKKRLWTEIYRDLTGVGNAQSTAKIRNYYKRYVYPYELHINGCDYEHLFAKAEVSEAKQSNKAKKSGADASESQQMKKRVTKDAHPKIHMSEDDAENVPEKAELEELMMDLDTYEALSQSQMAECLSQVPVKKLFQPPSSGDNFQDTEAVSALKEAPQKMPVETGFASPVPSFGSDRDDPLAAEEMAALGQELMSLQQHFDEMENIFYEH